MGEVLINLKPKTTQEKLLWERHHNSLFLQEIKKLEEHIEVLQDKNELLEASALKKKNSEQKIQLNSLNKTITSLKNRCNELQEENKTLLLKTDEYYKKNKMIDIVYECDKQRSCNSFCTKEIFTNKKKELAFYSKVVKLFTKQKEAD